MKVTPRWVSVALVVGAVICIAWAVFCFSFFSEPSADWRSKDVLAVWAGVSIWTAVIGVAGAIAIVRRAGWGRSIAWIAAALMALTLVAAIPGIAALMGLWSSRKSSNP